MNPMMQPPSDPMAGGGDPMQIMQLLAMLGGGGTSPGLGGAGAPGMMGLPPGMGAPAPAGGDDNPLLALLAQLMGGGGGTGMGLGGGGMGGGMPPMC